MLTLRTPTNRLFRFHPWFDDLISVDRETSKGELKRFRPAVDIEEDESRFTIQADLPGVREEDIEITVHEGTLVLSGKREHSKEEERDGSIYRERRVGTFCRQFRLGSHVAQDGIEASYNDGVLTVVLPKKQEVLPRQIPISAKA